MPENLHYEALKAVVDAQSEYLNALAGMDRAILEEVNELKSRVASLEALLRGLH
jgi:hypothetical protein